MRRAELVALGLVAAAVLAIPLLGSRLANYNMTLIALYATVVISLNLLLGLAGQASFAQTSFMAVGGYGTALLTTRLGVNPWLAIAASAVLALGLAFVIAKPLLRLRGHYLSMGTIALALGTFSFVNASSFTNGGWGISGIPALTLFGFSFRQPLAFYALSWLLCALALASFVLLERSHIGRALRALAIRQEIAASLGIDVQRYKAMAFMIAAVWAALAGAFYVEFTRFVGPDLYDVPVIVNLLLMLFIGGLGSTVGPIIGAGFVLLVPQLTAGFEQYQNLVFFVLLLLVILIWPGGLFGRSRGDAPGAGLMPDWLTGLRKRAER